MIRRCKRPPPPSWKRPFLGLLLLGIVVFIVMILVVDFIERIHSNRRRSDHLDLYNYGRDSFIILFIMVGCSFSSLAILLLQGRCCWLLDHRCGSCCCRRRCYCCCRHQVLIWSRIAVWNQDFQTSGQALLQDSISFLLSGYLLPGDLLFHVNLRINLVFCGESY